MAKTPKAASIAVKADNSHRVLLVQRLKGAAAGSWEFPGGKLSEGETAFQGAQREWEEETHSKLPDGKLIGSHTSSDGKHQTFVYAIKHESDVSMKKPKGSEIAAAAWWQPSHIPGNPAVRVEVQSTDWAMIGGASTDDGQTVEARAATTSPDAPESLTFAFDIDGTITAAVKQYVALGEALSAAGHRVIVVTARPDDGSAEKYLTSIDFEYDDIYHVERDGVANEKAEVLKEQHADFMFENRLASGPEISAVVPVTMQWSDDETPAAQAEAEAGKEGTPSPKRSFRRRNRDVRLFGGTHHGESRTVSGFTSRITVGDDEYRLQSPAGIQPVGGLIEPKNTQDEANYRTATIDNENCGACEWMNEDGTCQLVAGFVDAEHVCDYWTADSD